MATISNLLYADKVLFKDVVAKIKSEGFSSILGNYSPDTGDFIEDTTSLTDEVKKYLYNCLLRYWANSEIGYDSDITFIDRFNSRWYNVIDKYVALAKLALDKKFSNGYYEKEDKSSTMIYTPRIEKQEDTSKSTHQSFSRNNIDVIEHGRKDETTGDSNTQQRSVLASKDEAHTVVQASGTDKTTSNLTNSTEFNDITGVRTSFDGNDNTSKTENNEHIKADLDAAMLSNYYELGSVTMQFNNEFHNLFMEVFD